METIDLTPTWPELARIYMRFAECGESRALLPFRPEIEKMARMAETCKQLWPTLSPEQRALCDKLWDAMEAPAAAPAKHAATHADAAAVRIALAGGQLADLHRVRFVNLPEYAKCAIRQIADEPVWRSATHLDRLMQAGAIALAQRVDLSVCAFAHRSCRIRFADFAPAPGLEKL